MKTTLVVCESPWTEHDRRLALWSMRPFVEGIAELYAARLVYRTFTAGSELRRLLEGEAFDDAGQRILIYIACHGYGGRLTPGRKTNSGANLAPIARSLRHGVESVWLGACDVGGSNALHDFLAGSGAVWAGGYVCTVNWDASLLLDMAVLQELLKSGARKTRTGVVRTLKRAMESFDPRWIIGSDANGVDVCLRDALRVVARDKRQGARPQDVSRDLLSALRWSNS